MAAASGSESPEHKAWQRRIEQHAAVLAEMVAGDTRGVSRSDAARAAAIARKAALETDDPRIGFAVIGRGLYPYPPRDRRHFDETEWDEFLVVISDGDLEVASAACLPRRFTAGRNDAEIEQRLVPLLQESARRLASGLHDSQQTFPHLVMHVGLIFLKAIEKKR